MTALPQPIYSAQVCVPAHLRGLNTPLAGAGFANEAELQKEIERYFKAQGIPHEREYRIGGSRVDFALLTPAGKPWGLLECKWPLDTETLDLKDAADYFEQCIKYAIPSGLPVFVGPFFKFSEGVSGCFSGGSKPKAVAALSAIGGRMNCGLFFIHCQDKNRSNSTQWAGWQFTLRQQRVACHLWRPWDADFESRWPASPSDVALVKLHGAASEKTRT